MLAVYLAISQHGLTVATVAADFTADGREKDIGGSGGSLEPPGLFLCTSVPFKWRILSVFLPA